MEMTTWSRTATVVLTAGLFALGCGRCPQVKSPSVAVADPKNVADAISIQIQEYRAAYEARNIEAAAGLYSQTDDVMVTTQGRRSLGWTEVRASVGAFLGAQTEIKLRISDVSVFAMSKRAASASAKVHRTYGDGAQSMDDQGTLSLVYRREGDAWKIVAEHYSFAATQ